MPTEFAQHEACRSRAHCATCRSREAGRGWRSRLMPAFTLPGGEVDFACPHGLPWCGEGDAPPCDASVGGQAGAASRRDMEWRQTLGPLMWAELHSLSEVPSEEWLAHFAARVPCGECRFHWSNICRIMPPDTGSLAAFRRWTWRAHDAVNRLIGRAAVAFDRAAEMWGWEVETNGDRSEV